MNPMKRLLAAADKIEGAMRPTEDCGLPWSLGEDEILSADGEYIATATDPDGHLIVLAVNVMPALAAWLRWEATAACVPAHSRKALAVAAQILQEGDS